MLVIVAKLNETNHCIAFKNFDYSVTYLKELNKPHFTKTNSSPMTINGSNILGSYNTSIVQESITIIV